MVQKELIFETFYYEKGVVVLKELIFKHFLLWEGLVVLKELIFNSFYYGRVWWSSKNSFLTLSTLGGCGGPKRTHF